MIWNEIKYAIYIAAVFLFIYLIIRQKKNIREPKAIPTRYMFGIVFILMGAFFSLTGITVFIRDSETPPIWAITFIVLLFASGFSAIFTTRKLSKQIKNETNRK